MTKKQKKKLGKMAIKKKGKSSSKANKKSKESLIDGDKKDTLGTIPSESLNSDSVSLDSR